MLTLPPVISLMVIVELFAFKLIVLSTEFSILTPLNSLAYKEDSASVVLLFVALIFKVPPL